MWSSVHAKGYTLLVIITLVFAVIWGGHHHSRTVLVGTTVTSQLIKCQSHEFCPPEIVRTHAVYVTVPNAGSTGGPSWGQPPYGDVGDGGGRVG